MFKLLVEKIVLALVEYPDQVTIDEFVDGDSINLEIRVAESDAGRVIGRSGRVINAMRTVLQSVASKEGVYVSVEVV